MPPKAPRLQNVETVTGFEISNLGNTPATITKLLLTYHVPDGWSFVAPKPTNGNEYEFANIGYLGPKDVFQRHFSVHMLLTGDAVKSYSALFGLVLPLAPNGRVGHLGLTVKLNILMSLRIAKL